MCLLMERLCVLKCQSMSKEWFTFSTLGPLMLRRGHDVRSMATGGKAAKNELS